MKSLYFWKAVSKTILRALALALVGTAPVAAQGKAQANKQFFSDNELITIGTYYYPEQWPRENWARDIKKMAGQGKLRREALYRGSASPG